jgi:voltage-gated potassium channel
MSVAEYTFGASPASKLRFALLAMVVLIATGTIGFAVIEDMDPLNALYMTVITLSTVGFGEVNPLHPEGKLFAIALIIVGFFVVGSMVTFLGQMTLEGRFRELVVRRKMEKKLKSIKDHYIIAGYGRVGRHVTAEIAAKKADYVVIEGDREAVELLVAEGRPHVAGDATTEDVLAEAGIERARTLISTLPQEALNVYLTLTARHMNPKLNIIARADFEEGEKKLIRAGADHVVIPHVLGGIRMAKAALQPNVVDFMQMTSMGEAGLSVEELRIPDGAWLMGQSFLGSNLKRDYGVTVIGIKQQGEQMRVNPGPQTVINSGDILVILGDTHDLERLSQDLRERRERPG